MGRLRLVFRSLLFYWRTYLGVLCGCILSAAVLAGALFVGDSARFSLERAALTRLGSIRTALDGGNRTFREDFAGTLRASLDGAEVSAALHVRGMALREGSEQVNGVEIFGVDGHFLFFAESPTATALKAGEVALNEKLATALGAKPGDEISLRMFQPSRLPRGAPLSEKAKRETRRGLLTVKMVLTDAQLGRFSLKSDQDAPPNAFVDLPWLQEALELEGRANLIVAGSKERDWPRAGAAQAALEEAWTFDDEGLALRVNVHRRVVQLGSTRIYLSPQGAKEALEYVPESAGVLAYLVNSITSETGASIPYSFVTAITPSDEENLSSVPAGMKDDGIVVNRWLADQLSVDLGASLKVAYYELAVDGTFVEKSRTFIVHDIVGMNALGTEREMMLDFPGLKDVDSCKEWDIGIPLDEEKLEDEANEKYWDVHRQLPKAFVTLAAGREMWSNPYGDLMAVRYPTTAVNPNAIEEAMLSRLGPEKAGLRFEPVRDQALEAVLHSTDLGGLFLGMSFFLIASSLLLTGLLFTFSVEQRARETGVLMALGYPRWGVQCHLLAEAGVVTVLGSLLGVPLGLAFADFLIKGLGTVWSGAVAGAPIVFHPAFGSGVTAGFVAVVMALLAAAVASWRQQKRSVRELVAMASNLPVRSATLWWVITCLALLGVVALAVFALVSDEKRPAGMFFGAGALMLVGGIAFTGALLARRSGGLSVSGLGKRNASRHPWRGMATAGMLACGIFIVLSVSAMKEDLSLREGDRFSGTGGFELYGESSIGIRGDLEESIVPMRLREGDDASCLNLNHPQAPPLLGVDAEKMARLGAFVDPTAETELWELLRAKAPRGVVPAIVGDSDTAMWKLGKKVGGEEGDLLDYRDEHGRSFKVKLVAALPVRLSVLQGKLLISERRFRRVYPSEEGYRIFLVDVPAGEEAAVKARLEETFNRAGLEVRPSIEVLRELHVVESTYLMMFLLLGGLGVLLGTAGMAVLVFRNIMERRAELALLGAVGYSRGKVVRVVLAEHCFLLALGLLVGTASSAVAIVPVAAQPGVNLPLDMLGVFLLGTMAFSLAWIWISTRLALRGSLVSSLRSE